LIDEHRVLTADTQLESVEHASMLQRMRQIGKRTAEMHLAFACSDEDPAFRPEPIAADDVAHWTHNLAVRTQNAFGLLERLRHDLTPHAAQLAQRLLDNREAVLSYIESGRRAAYGGLKIRHHGDFHLGQVLIAKDDAYILDFEGEPRRSLEERRSKAPPARDVAGFLRSIDYAASAAIDRSPDLTAEERTNLDHRIRDWARDMREAYWESYRETLNGDSLLWPADEAETHALLDLFLLEKALYEIEYELTNRPSWSHIPLEGTLRILEQREVIGS